MGIKGLVKFLRDYAPKSVTETKQEGFTDRKLAIDASMFLYQFIIAIRDADATLTNKEGEVTSHLAGFLNRTINLLEKGVKPVYVFDGKPPEIKGKELAARREMKKEAAEALAEAKEVADAGADAETAVKKIAGRTVRVTKKQNEQAKTLLRLMGCPVIEAPSEAEATCAAICKEGMVYASATEDADCLTFGSPRLIRNLFAPAQMQRPILDICLSVALEQLNITMEQFTDLCILCGCDYVKEPQTIKGVGPAMAIRLISTHGSLEKAVAALDKEKYHVDDGFVDRCIEARRIFAEIEVSPIQELKPKIKWVEPDYDGLTKFLVEDNDFNPDRVKRACERLKKVYGQKTQLRLDSFFGTAKVKVSADDKYDPSKKKAKATAGAKAKGAAKAKPKVGAKRPAEGATTPAKQPKPEPKEKVAPPEEVKPAAAPITPVESPAVAAARAYDDDDDDGMGDFGFGFDDEDM
mmetsp:Transcript_40730/g.97758  ORF Transcript_40730/g.97758 Transcript_40730/m.97758 type:complete len:466 (-) Transcript_40730:272-1669(-)